MLIMNVIRVVFLKMCDLSVASILACVRINGMTEDEQGIKERCSLGS